MGWDVSTITKPIARRDYPCQASDWLINSDYDCIEMSDEELAIIEAAKKDGWMIRKGDRYVKINGLWDGEWQTFRGRIDLDKICSKYDIYFD